MARILLIDDDPQLTYVLGRRLREHGHVVDVAPTGELGVDMAQADPPELALIDISLPAMSGLETFNVMRQRDASLVGIFITGHGSIPSAIEAMRAGAFDYLTKPFDSQHLLLTIDRALQLRTLDREVGRLKEELSGRLEFPGIIGNSPPMQDLLRHLPRVATCDATVLLLGESGTGKELVARNIHRHSARAEGPFVAVNCSAVPAGLVESEFFGHERGAFTDAREMRVGRFEQANGGSLFLDEVSDLPLEAQAKLLRVLDDREVTRVGGRTAVPVSLRLIAATNRELEDAVRRGRFREDLFWRLNVVPLRLPPLRDRPDDLPLLIDYFVERIAAELGGRDVTVAAEARRMLACHDWPGNVRELENTLKRAIIMTSGSVIGPGDLALPMGRAPGALEPLAMAEVVARATARVERGLIEATLMQCRGSRTATAEALGINRKTLFNKMRQYGLTEQAQDDETP